SPRPFPRAWYRRRVPRMGRHGRPSCPDPRRGPRPRRPGPPRSPGREGRASRRVEPSLASLLLAAPGQGVLVAAQLVAPELTLVGPVDVLVVHGGRVPIRADHGDALALFERGLQRLLLPAGDLRLDGEGPVIELTELARLPLELSLGVVARLHRQRAALLLEFGDEVARQAGE